MQKAPTRPEGVLLNWPRQMVRVEAQRVKADDRYAHKKLRILRVTWHNIFLLHYEKF